MGFVHADQAYKRTHADMMSGVVDDLLHLNQRRAAYEAVLKRYGDVLPNAAELSRDGASRAGEGGPVGRRPRV